MKKYIKLMTAVSLNLLIISCLPGFADSYHQGGQINLRWSTSKIFLNQNSYIEQEFIPVNNESFIDGEPFKWSSQYHFDFCWQGKSSLTSDSQRCGYVGFGLGSKMGNNYFGNFDLAIFNGIDFSILTNSSQVNCDKRNEQGYIDNTMTYYVTCWHGVVIQMNTPYVMRVQYDPSNTSQNNNWWSATLTNKKTNETITIGKIKAIGNAYQESLSSLQTVMYYSGNPKSCDAVPTMDTRVLPIVSTNLSSEFIGNWLGNCVRAISTSSKEFPGYYSVRLGGDAPESREPGFVKVTATPSSSKSTIIEIQKPKAPLFAGLKIQGNTLNINVNLNSSKPDYVYLIAPKLTGNATQKLLGTIDGDYATWSIKFDPNTIKGVIPLKFVSSKSGLTSDETGIEYLFPPTNVTQNGINKAPLAPFNIKTKFLSTQILITAKLATTGNAAAENAFFYSRALGISKTKPIFGDLLANSVVFSIPISSYKLIGNIDINLVAQNKIGLSKVAVSKYEVPMPKSPVNNQNTQTVVCTKGLTVRTFASKVCPPGWQVK